MNKLFLSITACMVLAFAKAQQTTDSLQQKATVGIKEKFPRSRVLNFEYGQSLSRDFDSELFEEEFQEGTISAQRNFNATANIPIYKTQKWSLTGSVNYQFNEFEFEDITTLESIFLNKMAL